MGRIDDYRVELDQIDEELVHLLVRRFHIARNIGVEKAKTGQGEVDIERELKVVNRALDYVEDQGDEQIQESVRRAFYTIIMLSRGMQ